MTENDNVQYQSRIVIFNPHILQIQKVDITFKLNLVIILNIVFINKENQTYFSNYDSSMICSNCATHVL